MHGMAYRTADRSCNDNQLVCVRRPDRKTDHSCSFAKVDSCTSVDLVSVVLLCRFSSVMRVPLRMATVRRP